MNTEKLSQTELTAITTEAEEKKLIDDYTFACWWVEQRNNFKPRSPAELRAELYRKGVSTVIISEVIDDLVNEKIIKENIAELIAKKFPSAFTDQSVAQRAITYLRRKGYPYGLIKRVISGNS